MSHRARAWLQDLAHLFTIVSALVVLGVGGTLAVVFQAVLGALFVFSPLERVLLGVFAFFVVLAVIIAVLKRRSNERSLNSAPKSDGTQELEQSRLELRESKREREELRRRNAELELEKETLHNDVNAISDELSIVKRSNEQLEVEVGRLRGFEQEFAEQLAIVASLEAQIKQSKSEAEQDEELKQRCRLLSGELFQFAEARDKDDPQHDTKYPTWIPETQADHDIVQTKTRYDEESWALYRQRYEGRVRALLNAIERREWCTLEERREIESELDAFWRSPSQRIERVAARLDAFGKRLDGGIDLPNHQTSDEELKIRCRELAEDLHEFLEDYAMDEAGRAEAMGADFELDVLRADTKTMREFRKRLKPRVMEMLAELKRRRWWEQQNFDLSEWEAIERLAHPQDLQLVADRLERLGYEV